MTDGFIKNRLSFETSENKYDMERRDYLVSQIQEMGSFFAKLLGRLRKDVRDREEDHLLTEARDALSIQFGWDLEELLFLDNSSFISLMEENLLAVDHFEKMAAIFELLGESDSGKRTLLQKELYFRKALTLLEHIENKSSTYSMERRDRIAQINLKMNR